MMPATRQSPVPLQGPRIRIGLYMYVLRPVQSQQCCSQIAVALIQQWLQLAISCICLGPPSIQLWPVAEPEVVL